MPAPTITTLPEAPSIADPANFPAEASAHVASLSTLVTELNAFGDFLDTSNYNGVTFGTARSTYGGTADAITLTTGASLSSLTTGLRLRTRATATNTGPMTANVDGIGLVTVKTITGADTPAGYIRTDADTEFTYDGTNLIADRQLEVGSNANGIFIRLANGYMECSRPDTAIGNIAISTAYLGGFRSLGTLSWTYPAAFISAPSPNASPSDTTSFSVLCITPSATSVTLMFTAVTSQTATTRRANCHASGLWY